MDFYIDENLSPRIAKALDGFEVDHNVYHTQVKWAKGIKDVPLIDLLNQVKCTALITNDLKFSHRLHQYREYKENGISVFMISITSGANDDLRFKEVVSKWALIKKLSEGRKRKHPFICRIYRKRVPEADNNEYRFFD